MAKKRSLGRGLEALLSDLSSSSQEHEPDFLLEDKLLQIPLTQIQKGKFQPRRQFSENSLKELADSIRAQGVIQPIIVRSVGNNFYEIIAGERRWRAAQIAGLEKIPAVLRELPDEATVAVALIENIQRESLNPIEEASAMQRLIDEFSLTHEQVANAVGKSRASITNSLRLLSLSDFVKNMVVQSKLEMGHARALLALSEEQQINAAQIIFAKTLSVRETEALVRKILQDKGKQKMPLSESLGDLERSLSLKLGWSISIKQNNKGKGKLMINYKNQKELDVIIARLEEKK